VAPLQERYADTKEAAEKFQILQVGLTIAHEDPVSGGIFFFSQMLKNVDVRVRNIHAQAVQRASQPADRSYTRNRPHIQHIKWR
jgi:hypothetical protein